VCTHTELAKVVTCVAVVFSCVECMSLWFFCLIFRMTSQLTPNCALLLIPKGSLLSSIGKCVCACVCSCLNNSIQ